MNVAIQSTDDEYQISLLPFQAPVCAVSRGSNGLIGYTVPFMVTTGGGGGGEVQPVAFGYWLGV